MIAERWLDLGEMDRLARIDSPIRRIDPCGKVIVTFLFVLAVASFPRGAVSALLPFALFPVMMIALGRVPLVFLGKKLFLAAPFALAIGALDPLLDPRPAIQVGTWVISAGWLSCLSILLRFVLTVSAVLALLACTGLPQLVGALGKMGVPEPIAAQGFFLYRYLFVIVAQGASLVRAVQLRGGTVHLPRRAYAGVVGQLFLRSLDRAERVHQAMRCRGYEGKMRPWRSSRFGWCDACFVAGWSLFFIVAWRWDLPSLAGDWWIGGRG